MTSGLSWNLYADVAQMLQYQFMVNAFLAGAMAAVTAGVAGYFVVLRSQTFAGHALSHVGFSGATAALLFGVPTVLGLTVAAVASGAAIGGMEGRRPGSRAAGGIPVAAIFTFALGLGVLFLQLYKGQSQDAYSILFGNVLGIADADLVWLAVVGGLCLIGLAVLARPLFLASVEPDLATARGVPTQLLGIVFLCLLALCVVESVQVVGILMIFALLVTPAAVAQALTIRPWRALLLSPFLAMTFTWAGITVGYYVPNSVVGFDVTSLAFGSYLLVKATVAMAQRAKRTQPDRPILFTAGS